MLSFEPLLKLDFIDKPVNEINKKNYVYEGNSILAFHVCVLSLVQEKEP